MDRDKYTYTYRHVLLIITNYKQKNYKQKVCMDNMLNAKTQH